MRSMVWSGDKLEKPLVCGAAKEVVRGLDDLSTLKRPSFCSALRLGSSMIWSTSANCSSGREFAIARVEQSAAEDQIHMRARVGLDRHTRTNRYAMLV